MRQMRRRQHDWRAFLLTVVLVACSLAALHFGIEWVTRLETRRQPVTSPGPDVVGQDTRFLWVTSYSICGDEERRQSGPDATAVGRTREQLQAANPGWTIETFTAAEVCLRRTEQLCPLHRDNRTLMISGDAVVIYYGTPDQLGPRADIVEGLSPWSLTEEDRQRLERGMRFQNSDQNQLEESIQSYLEGIAE